MYKYKILEIGTDQHAKKLANCRIVWSFCLLCYPLSALVVLVDLLPWKLCCLEKPWTHQSRSSEKISTRRWSSQYVILTTHFSRSFCVIPQFDCRQIADASTSHMVSRKNFLFMPIMVVIRRQNFRGCFSIMQYKFSRAARSIVHIQ